MALSSSSTLAQCEAQYDDNANWRDGAGDVSKGRLFAQACRILLRRYNSSVGAGGASIARNVDLMRQQLDEVIDWLATNDSDVASGAGVVGYQDFRGGRD